MTEHTPGPWYVMPNGIFVGDKKVWFDESGARCGETPNIIIDCPSEGDAHLISAAPDLLDAARRIAAWIEREAIPYLVDSDDNPGEALRAAIAKAEGRTDG